METIFEYNLQEILKEINGEPALIPYWIKLDLLDHGVPINIDPLDVKNEYFNVHSGKIEYNNLNGMLIVKWKR